MVNFTVLKNISRIKKYPRESVIANESQGAELIVVLKGQAGLFGNYGKQNETMLTTVGPGGFFGEEALLLDRRPQAAAVALTDVIALPINRRDALTFIQEEPELALELMRAFAFRNEAADPAVKPAPKQVIQPKSPSQAQAQAPASAKPAAAAPVKAAPAASVKDAAAPVAARASAVSFFPEGHGSYQLELNSEDRYYLMERAYTCPYCKKEFKTLAVRSSRLMQVSTDNDMRSRYKGIEPLYYDAVTCPNCLYSALSEMFSSPDNMKADLSEIKELKGCTEGMFGLNIDTESVFARYYIALQCAEKCFTLQRLASAKLYLKLSRIYQDCGDARMEQEAARKALDAYMEYYLKELSDPGLDQQLCVVMGELYLKLGDLKSARDYFFKAKTNRIGTPMLKNHSENRLSIIREMG